MLELAHKDVLVLGLGISGRSAAAFCAERGARVVACDERPRDALEDLAPLAGRVDLVCGRAFPDPAGFDVVVPSPGIPRPRYADRARCVWGDIELAGRALAVPIIAVTGTNGKSTTCRLIEAMLRAAGLRAEAAGNIGTPSLALVGRPLDAAVLEVSSFQLEAIDRFRPRVSVILNLAPDHLDRHGSFERYVDTKARLLANQQPHDDAVLNAADPVVWALAARTRARVSAFHDRAAVERGCWLDTGAIAVRDAENTLRIPLDGLALRGRHNRENALAATAAVAALGVDAGKAAQAFIGFRGLPHRFELVCRIGDVDYVDDSKATNVSAALRSLESCESRVVWIAGGRDKDLDFTPLARAAATRVRAAILIGESAPRLARALADRVPSTQVASIEAAVAEAANAARPG
ncbi:MAG: UDP-N-acetylmuramoyl-L-alanine--D-glutamate ligase, partial [Deltaproteobacteria bacterium]